MPKSYGQIRKKTKSAQRMLLSAIINHHRGITRTSELLSRELGLPFTKWTVVNWVTRERVPLLYVERVAKVLGVSPYALNFLEYSDFKDSDKTWDRAVASVQYLSDKQRADIEKLEPPV